MKSQMILNRYSEAFKRKVVSEIENGKLRISEDRRMYNIPGGLTIQRWLKKLGKEHLLNKVIHIEMKDEVNRLKELEKQRIRIGTGSGITVSHFLIF